MQPAAELILNEVLTKYGVSACNTPHMLETLLRKYGRGCPSEVEILNAVLRAGVVADLRTGRGGGATKLARTVIVKSPMAPAQAEWAVHAWAAALAHAPSEGSKQVPAEETVSPQPYSAGRAVAVLALAAATGVVAYLTFGQ
jgi:hypothetical protein